jgi:hypothetical protein
MVAFPVLSIDQSLLTVRPKSGHSIENQKQQKEQPLSPLPAHVTTKHNRIRREFEKGRDDGSGESPREVQWASLQKWLATDGCHVMVKAPSLQSKTNENE